MRVADAVHVVKRGVAALGLAGQGQVVEGAGGRAGGGGGQEGEEEGGGRHGGGG